MERKKFIQFFSKRLTTLMQQKGYGGSRSKTGIDIQMLSKVTGCSYQMTRKYAMGEVMPELSIVLKIAEWFEISPSWLLFGDDEFSELRPKISDNIIEIDQGLLRYILEKCIIFLTLSNNKKEALDFIIETIYDASHLKADIKTIHKIIDMMVSSTNFLIKNKDFEVDGKVDCSK